MPIDITHSIIGTVYVLIWLLIASVTVRHRRTDSDTT